MAIRVCRELYNCPTFRKDAAILSNFNDTIPVEKDPPQCPRQYIADNVDWNSATIDGKGSIHIQGMMGAVTPALHTTYHNLKKSNLTSHQLKELIDTNMKYLSSSEIKQSSYLRQIKFVKARSVPRSDLSWNAIHFQLLTVRKYADAID